MVDRLPTRVIQLDLQERKQRPVSEVGFHRMLRPFTMSLTSIASMINVCHSAGVGVIVGEWYLP